MRDDRQRQSGGNAGADRGMRCRSVPVHECSSATSSFNSTPRPDSSGGMTYPSSQRMGFRHASDLLCFQYAADAAKIHLKDRGGAGFEHARKFIFRREPFAGCDRHAALRGDLGHLLTEDQLRQIGAIDILLIPVGGIYTLNGDDKQPVGGYNFGTAAAALLRWQAGIDAKVDFLATDQYEDLARVRAAALARWRFASRRS